MTASDFHADVAVVCQVYVHFLTASAEWWKRVCLPVAVLKRAGAEEAERIAQHEEQVAFESLWAEECQREVS